MTGQQGLLRHIRRCRNAHLPGDRLQFRIGGAAVGWVRPALAEALDGFPEIRIGEERVTLLRADALPGIARALSDRGFYRWRNEAFDVRVDPEGPALTTIDRGALPSFGLLALGVHVNGLVRRTDGLHLWVGRRAADKHLDPGKLDHIVAGGVAAGHTPWETLLKEAEEEAAIPASFATGASLQGQVSYAMERPEGLRRDTLYCYDLLLPETFLPRPADGEVEIFELWPLARALDVVRETDQFKFNVNMVLIDLFLRLGMIRGEEADELRAELAAKCE